MALHKELFTDLPPAEEMRRDVAGNLAQKYEADGFYILVQYIAEKYGDRAYSLAEEVFQEMGLEYDVQALRTPDRVRRIDYNFTGSNIYNLTVKPFAPEMAGELVRLYNEQIRKISYAALITQADFMEHIAGVGRLLVACRGRAAGRLHPLYTHQRRHANLFARAHLRAGAQSPGRRGQSVFCRAEPRAADRANPLPVLHGGSRKSTGSHRKEPRPCGCRAYRVFACCLTSKDKLWKS